MPMGGVLDQNRRHDHERSSYGPSDRRQRPTFEVVIGDQHVLELEPGSGRVLVHLSMPAIDRSVEISASPATAARAVEDTAIRTGTPISRALADTRRILDEACAAAGAWSAAPAADLVGAFGGAAFPLLGAAYENGAAPIPTVPPWAVAILSAATPAEAARTAFAERATRPVTAAFARSLLRCGDAPVDLSRLALALMGAPALEPDQIAAVLDAPGDAWNTAALPSPAQIELAGKVAIRWGARRTASYLTQGALDADGQRSLVECVAYAADLGPHGPFNVPTCLEALRDLYRLHIRSAPSIRQAPRPNRAAPVPTRRHEDVPGATAAIQYPALVAPRCAQHRGITSTTPIPTPGWLAGLEGTTTAAFSFTLPHCVNDLRRWGDAMSNCLASYGPAAVQGLSHLIGVTEAGHLRYVIELSPQRTIRQFNGKANRPIARDAHNQILEHLRSLRVLR